MSKDIIVLAPNGRRQKVHCTPDTSILQVLEDVCQKQGFQPSDYDLKHHNKILDLTSTIRFSNLPNKATLEMVDVSKKREESNVVIGLLLEDGERRTAEFPSTMSLYNIISSLAPTELSSLQHPTILYMRQEVTGVDALQQKTLRQLGLIGGRAILRLLNKAEEARQANVSSVYRRPEKEKQVETMTEKNLIQQNFIEEPTPGPSHINEHNTNVRFDPVKLLKEEKVEHESKLSNTYEAASEHKEFLVKDVDMIQSDSANKLEPMDVEPHKDNQPTKTTPRSTHTQETLERRLKIEEEVTFLGSQKAIAFMQPETVEDELEDLPDDFYELTIEEVRKLYNDLQRQRLSLENMPLLTLNKRDELESQSSQQRLNTYKNVVVRIQFPDHIILQGIFLPTDKIEDVINFIKEHLHYPDRAFHIFTTPFKDSLDPKTTLGEAKFVPCVHMHFRWLEDDKKPYLKEEDYLRKTSSDAAAILASKYRAPSRKTLDETSNSSRSSQKSASTSQGKKVPKWFKN